MVTRRTPFAVVFNAAVNGEDDVVLAIAGAPDQVRDENGDTASTEEHCLPQ